MRDQFLRFLTELGRRILSAAAALDQRALVLVRKMVDRPLDVSPDRAESRADLALRALRTAMSAAGRSGEGLMRLSRAKKAVLVGAVLIAIGLTGRASAEAARDTTGTLTATTASASAGAQPRATPAAKSKPRKPVARKIKNPRFGGPAGSHMLTGTKGVALTFDDGPDPYETPRLLQLLAKHHVKATFCLVGEQVQRHPDIVRKIVAQGHTLCNHTWDHSLKLGKDPEAHIRSDLSRTNAAIHQAAPGAKVKYFRAPGGNFTPLLVSTAKQLGMTSIYWKVDPRDWSHHKGESSKAHQAKVVAQIEKHCRPGAIVLSHDYGQPDTIAAYRKLLPWLKKRYTLVALP
ncbi:polysaccharide deacetylase family protein [Paractinoplanes maris]|uniref:polysaccharide deacetylase family protein n=1 Tax=Paractinoplanes maris TaxID=1734446 RepID=UPI00201FFE3B|nr:polysaccharide deacetylase family protein [Actinoplanes maris]